MVTAGHAKAVREIDSESYGFTGVGQTVRYDSDKSRSRRTLDPTRALLVAFAAR